MIGPRKSATDLVQQGDRFFRWRGGEVSRLESLFDAVIALAVTLTIVSLEVPGTFDELWISFRKLPGFAICFAILTMCWYYHFLFHRRYGIEDFPVVVLNSILMFLIVFYVYPLKFIFTFTFDRSLAKIDNENIPTLLYLYSGGFVAIFVIQFLLFGYAYLKREGLGLSYNEEILTKQKLGEHLVYILLGLTSIVLACFDRLVPFAGLIYFLLGPLQGIHGYWWGRYIDEQEGSSPEERSDE